MKKLLLIALLSGVLVQGLEGAAPGWSVKSPANDVEAGPRQSRRLQGMEPEFEGLSSGSRKRKDHPTEISQGPVQMQAVPAAVEAPSEPVEPVDVPSRRRLAEYSRVKRALASGQNVGFAFATEFLGSNDVNNLKSALGSAAHDGFGLARAAAVKRIKIICASLIEKYGPNNVLFYPENTDNSPEVDDLSDALTCVDVVRELIAQGANPLATSFMRQRPIHNAAACGKVEVVRALLEAVTDAKQRVALINMVDAQGRTALYAAAGSGHVEVVNALLEAVTDARQRFALINSVNALGWTALHAAAGSGHVEVVKALLEAVTDAKQRVALINMVNDRGLTALHVAAYGGHVGVVGALLEAVTNAELRMALMNTVNAQGWAALHFAAGRGHVEAVKALLNTVSDAEQRMALMNRTTVQRNTALHVAADRGYAVVVKALLEAVTDAGQRVALMTKPNAGGKTALQVAQEKGHQAIVALLEAVVAADGVMPDAAE